jgi:hypothetical protein
MLQESVEADIHREVIRVKALSNAWDDLAATALTGEGFDDARARFWRLHNSKGQSQ